MPFYIAGVTALITFFLVWFLLKESLAKETRGQTNKKKTSLLGELKGSHSILFMNYS
jgi:predicted MFS family arabinose efflux permease